MRSYYTRTIVALTLGVISVFIIMTLSYLDEINSFLTHTQSGLISRQGNLLHDRLEAYCDDELNPLDDKNVGEDIDFISRASQAYVWLVSPDGVVLRASSFPRNMDLTTVDAITGRHKLPANYIGNDVPEEGYIYSGGNYFGLFNYDGLVWISYVRPVIDQNNQVRFILQIHKPLDLAEERQGLFLNGLGFSLLIALIIAIVFVFIGSQRLVKPLREMSAAAAKVAQGDLSVRLEEGSDVNNEEFILQVSDELTVLRCTFNDMVEKLDNMNSDRRDMISSISHDLRTPLTSISGFVTGMLDGTIPQEKFPRYLMIVDKETTRMKNLVRQMHEMMLLESNAIQYNFVNLDIIDLLTEVISSLETQLDEKHLTLQTNFTAAKDAPLIVIGDRQQLGRVIMNLLTNSIKFTPDGGVIAVTVERQHHAKLVHVTVEDSGPGIPDKDIKLIFNRFYKSDRSRTGNSGSGLGLFITKQILAAHGQHIQAGRSGMGGAKFTFSLQVN